MNAQELRRKLGMLLLRCCKRSMVDFCKWSKEAEWKDGATKTAFIKGDWDTYVNQYFNWKSGKELEVKP